jgi:hypothetical protein
MVEFDHKGAIISYSRNCYSIGSPIDGIKDVVGPIVALLKVHSDFLLGEFALCHHRDRRGRRVTGRNQ